jgi:hypothetical protein
MRRIMMTTLMAALAVLAVSAAAPAASNSAVQTEQAVREDPGQKETAQTAEQQAQAEAQKKAEAQAAAAEQYKAQAEKIQEEQRAAAARQMAELEVVVKTYTLRYVNPRELVEAGRLYLMDQTISNNILTVRMRIRDIPAFEDLIKKMDVEKKNILFQVYTIVASRDPFSEAYLKTLPRSPNEEIENKGLKKVFEELKGLWNFKSYFVDNPSFIAVKDGSGLASMKLVTTSYYDLYIHILHVQARGDEPGKRIISVGQIQLTQSLPVKETLIDTRDLSFKENGYLVVGVSGTGSSEPGKALILVINAEIK